VSCCGVDVTLRNNGCFCVSVVALPAYREAVFAQAPAIARFDAGGARSVFFGCNFHIHEHGIDLIEFNTGSAHEMEKIVR
jgi:hypothetical protein